MKLKLTLIAVCIFLFLPSVKAQDETAIQQGIIPQEEPITPQDIYIFWKVGENEVKLRWAPSDAEIWLQGNKYGYQLEKAILNLAIEPVFKKMTNQAIKPWPLADWESIANAENPYAVAAAMTIHGKDKQPATGFAAAHQNLNNKFGMALLSADLDKRAAEASGLSFTDKGTKSGDIIAYRIYVLDSLSNPVSDTTMQYVVVGEPNDFAGPNKITTSENEHEVVLYWDKYYMGSLNTAYHIERSSDGGTTFKRVNKSPYIDISTNLITNTSMMSYSDSVAENYVPYYYRIIALDAFGDESKPSKPIEAMGRDRTPPVAITELETVESPGSSVNLKWTYPKEELDIAGFKVYHFIKEEKNKKVIAESLGKDARSFTHTTPDTKSTNYYIVSALDKEGNEARSHVVFAMVTDVTPPGPPTNLQATIDSLGGLLLLWDAPTDNDIRGYQVFYSNEPDENFTVQKGPYLEQTHFVKKIPIRTLTEEIYLYVLAIDNSYNVSKASEVIKVKKPDVVPPAASFFSDYYVSEEGISFTWVKSSSNDVARVELKRRKLDSDWAIIKEFNQNERKFLDKKVEEGVYYEYKLWTYDDDGNKSVTDDALSLKALKSFYLKNTPILTSNVSEDSLILNIEFPKGVATEFVIYRADGEEALSIYEVIDAASSYKDSHYKKGATYKYAAIARGADGRESKQSNVVLIKK
jgi:hypothetical protein